MAKVVINKKQAIVSQKDFNIVFRIIKANWWVPIAVIPVFYLLGMFYVYRLTYVYKASTEFLIKPNDSYYQNNVLSESSFYAYGTYVDNLNEKRIVQSYDLANKVVDKLLDRIQVSYFIVGKVRTTEQFKGLPFKVNVNSVNPNFFEKIIDISIIDYDNYELSFEDNGKQQNIKGRFDQDLIDLKLGIKISRGETFDKNTADAFKAIFYQFSIHSKDFLIAKIRNNLTVENPEYTNILKIELKDILPERAVLMLDTLNVVYAESKLKTRFELNDRTISFIDIQLDQITGSLKSIEDTMQNYKEEKSILDLDWQQNDYMTKIGAFDSEKSKLEFNLSTLDDLEKYIIEDKDPQFLPPGVFVSEKSGFMSTAVIELYSKQLELNRLYGMAKEDNPVVTELKANIKKTKHDLLVYISNSRKAARQQVESIDKQMKSYIGVAKLIPAKQRDILNIKRKASVNEQLYNFLLEKKATTKIARASIVTDVKIVESPRFSGVVSPDKNKIQNLFLSLGLLVTLVITLFRTFVFGRIKTVEHLKDLTTLPLIGVIPFIKSNETDGIIVEQSPNSLIAESFRNFRTNLQYANVDINAKSYLVTSFLPGEGKTFTSVNLAAIMAKTGKKTVVIELDLHKPRIYKRFGLDKQLKGITTYITGQSTYEEILTPTRIPNLYCIFSGPVPPNPSELVLSDKMKQIIDKAKEDFDYVIIDTPPAGLLSDSVYLIQQVDASIFVLNTRTSSKKVVTFIENLIVDNNLSNLLLLLNGVARPGRRYYYQGYGYSYGYGYGYGYGKGHSYRK